jgi:hypothetical protein
MNGNEVQNILFTSTEHSWILYNVMFEQIKVSTIKKIYKMKIELTDLEKIE